MKYTLAFKSSASPCATLSKQTMEKFLASRADSVALVIAAWRARYKSVTGKTPRLNHEQESLLLAHFGADNHGYWQSQYSSAANPLHSVISCFKAGFIADSAIPQEDLLLVAEAFFDSIDALESKNGRKEHDPKNLG